MRSALVLPVVLLLAVSGASGAGGWQKGAPMLSPRSEVAAATFRGGIAVVGGFSPGRVSKKVELYQPARRRWRSLPDLPIAVNHAAAAAAGGKLYVVGGYGSPRLWVRAAFVLDGTRWRKLAPMPGPRGAAAAAVSGGKLYALGGVAPSGLAETAFVLDLATGRWAVVPGPKPREHLAAATADGRVYALAGRLGGVDANLGTFEVFVPSEGRWEELAPVPEPRSGTGLALARGMLVSVGGEGPDNATIGSVFGYELATGTWRRLPDLPTPRHGMAVAAVNGKVYAIGGSPIGDLGYSTANEFIDPSG
jgi:N-acetylneuraminic acid mutarotase